MRTESNSSESNPPPPGGDWLQRYEELQRRVTRFSAVEQGLIQINKLEIGEEYLLRGPNGWLPVLEFGDYLDVLGGVGYYGEGPSTAVKACLEGISPQSDQMVDELQAVRKKLFDAEAAGLQAGGLHETPHIQWFHVQDRFFPMGVKMIGAFCDAIKGTDLVDPDKYIAGFQIVPDEVPGFGPIPLHQAKISMRVSPSMEGEIRAGRALGLHTFLPEATQRLGGFSDACHSLTAATTIATGKEEQLIAEMEELLGDGQHG